jgi:hypothetical protein
MLWLWGVVALYSPSYLDREGNVQQGFAFAIGFAFITIGFAGALTELAKFQKNEAWGYWGASCVFLVPAAVLHSIVSLRSLDSLAELVARMAVLGLAAVGGGLFLYGVAFFFWLSPETESGAQVRREPLQPQTIVSLVGAALTITATVLKIVLGLNR